MTNQAQLEVLGSWSWQDFTQSGNTATNDIGPTFDFGSDSAGSLLGSVPAATLPGNGSVSASWNLGASVQQVSLSLAAPWNGNSTPGLQGLASLIGALGTISFDVQEKFTDYITNNSSAPVRVSVTFIAHGTIAGVVTHESYGFNAFNTADGSGATSSSSFFNFTGGSGSQSGSFTIPAGATFEYDQTLNFGGQAVWEWPLVNGGPDGYVTSLVETGHVQVGEVNNRFQVIPGNPDLTFASGIDFSAPPCFTAGTRIRTAAGECAVEALRVGDLLMTAAGGLRPIRWIGHRRTDCRRHPRPWDVHPVRVRAQAFGPGMPAADVVLSPDHAVYADDVLIPVRYLINGSTIVQEKADEVTYYHVELDCHDVVLAEGLACESYLDTGNRSAFANAGAPVALHADFVRRKWKQSGCAKLVLKGRRLERVRRRVLARAHALGHATTTDPALHGIAGGRIINPMASGRIHRLQLAADAMDVRLISRSAVPAHVHPDSDDHRQLGIAVSRLWLDGREIGLESPVLSSGWHQRESGWRWSDGDAGLALAGGGTLEIEVAMTTRYWVAAADRSPAPVAHRAARR